jgi:hypothetical protein
VKLEVSLFDGKVGGGLLVQEKETKGWSFERRDEGVVPLRVPEAGEEEKKKTRGGGG